MKRTLLKIVSAFLSLILLCSVVLIPSFAEDVVTEDNLLVLLDEAVFVENGQMIIAWSEDALSKIDAETLAYFSENIEKVNDLIESGELCVTDNGTLYEASDDELVVQGGNVTKAVWHWWGMEFYFAHNLVPNLIRSFTKLSNFCTLGTIVGSIICCFPPAVAVGIGVLAGFGLSLLNVQNLLADLNYYYSISSGGIIISAWWLLRMSVSLQ